MRSDTNVQSQLVGRNYCSNGSWHCFASYWPCPASLTCAGQDAWFSSSCTAVFQLAGV